MDISWYKCQVHCLFPPLDWILCSFPRILSPFFYFPPTEMALSAFCAIKKHCFWRTFDSEKALCDVFRAFSCRCQVLTLTTKTLWWNTKYRKENCEFSTLLMPWGDEHLLISSFEILTFRGSKKVIGVCFCIVLLRLGVAVFIYQYVCVSLHIQSILLLFLDIMTKVFLQFMFLISQIAGYSCWLSLLSVSRSGLITFFFSVSPQPAACATSHLTDVK